MLKSNYLSGSEDQVKKHLWVGLGSIVRTTAKRVRIVVKAGRESYSVERVGIAVAFVLGWRINRKSLRVVRELSSDKGIYAVAKAKVGLSDVTVGIWEGSPFRVTEKVF